MHYEKPHLNAVQLESGLLQVRKSPPLTLLTQPYAQFGLPSRLSLLPWVFGSPCRVFSNWGSVRILCKAFEALLTVRAIDGASGNAGTAGCGPGGGQGELCSLRGENAKHDHGSPLTEEGPSSPRPSQSFPSS